MSGYTSHGFDTEAKWCNVEQQHIFHFASEHRTLNGRTNRNRFIRVHALIGLLTKEFLNYLLHSWNPCGSTNKNDFVDLVCRKTCIFQCLLTRLETAFK